MRAPPAPADLGKAGLRLWRDVAGEWDLSEPDLALLTQAARVADHLADLAESATGQPAVVSGRFGQLLTNPVFPEIRAERRLLIALLGALGFTSDAPEAAQPGPRVARSRRAP
jgi:hypothetical protein